MEKLTKKEAYRILELHCDGSYTECEIRKQYKILALQYHPDKNKDIGATKRFQEIADAMEYLCNNETNHYNVGYVHESYRDIMRVFMGEIFQEDTIHSILQNMIHLYQDKVTSKAIEFMRRINKDILIQIRKVIELYRPIFHLPDSFIGTLDEIIKERMEKDERIIFHPTLGDLFKDLLYKYTAISGEVFCVPLWHHSLVYDNSGADLYIECFPILPDNMWIDEYNQLHVELSYRVLDLWSKETIKVEIVDRVFYIPLAELFMTPTQIYHIKGCGISAINMVNIYHVEKRMDIILYLTIQ